MSEGGDGCDDNYQCRSLRRRRRRRSRRHRPRRRHRRRAQ